MAVGTPTITAPGAPTARDEAMFMADPRGFCAARISEVGPVFATGAFGGAVFVGGAEAVESVCAVGTPIASGGQRQPLELAPFAPLLASAGGDWRGAYESLCAAGFHEELYAGLFAWVPKFKETGGFSTFRFEDFIDPRVRKALPGARRLLFRATAPSLLGSTLEALPPREGLSTVREWGKAYAALASDRPFIPVYEADTTKGGASLAVLMDECRANCVDVAPAAYPSYCGPDQMLARIFGVDPIVWVRVNAFQLESLKAVALRMLLHSPYYASCPAELAAGVMVPRQPGPCAFSGPVTILVCRDNQGAVGIARELKNAAGEGRGSTATAEAVVIRDAEEALEGVNVAPLSGHVVFLLYLNDQTFLDAGGAVARLVQAAMDRRIAIAMVHEQELSCGGCAFRNVIQQTPQVSFSC